MNYFELSTYLNDENSALQFCVQNQLIFTQRICPQCGNIAIAFSYNFRLILRCVQCHSKISIFNGTIFENSKLRIKTVIQLLYYFSIKMPQHQTAFELKISQHTISLFYSKFRRIIANYVKTLPKIGGFNRIIEVDECMVAKQKYHVGRINGKHLWVVGALDRTTGEIRMQLVPNRTKFTLCSFLRKHVSGPCTIISDEWKGYTGLSSLGAVTHLTVNHSKHFVNPSNPVVNTQRIERNWVEYKVMKCRNRGIYHLKIPDYCSEMVLRKHCKIHGINFFDMLLMNE